MWVIVHGYEFGRKIQKVLMYGYLFQTKYVKQNIFGNFKLSKLLAFHISDEWTTFYNKNKNYKSTTIYIF